MTSDRDTLEQYTPFVEPAVIDDLRAPVLARTGDWFPSLAQTLIVQARRG